VHKSVNVSLSGGCCKDCEFYYYYCPGPSGVWEIRSLESLYDEVMIYGNNVR
jgi:hypothetical protein